MAKKKMSKKTKYTLLGIGLVAVGAGYFIAKHFKSSVAGIGAVEGKYILVYDGRGGTTVNITGNNFRSLKEKAIEIARKRKHVYITIENRETNKTLWSLNTWG